MKAPLDPKDPWQSGAYTRNAYKAQEAKGSDSGIAEIAHRFHLFRVYALERLESENEEHILLWRSRALIAGRRAHVLANRAFRNFCSDEQTRLARLKPEEVPELARKLELLGSALGASRYPGNRSRARVCIDSAYFLHRWYQGLMEPHVYGLLCCADAELLIKEEYEAAAMESMQKALLVLQSLMHAELQASATNVPASINVGQVEITARIARLTKRISALQSKLGHDLAGSAYDDASRKLFELTEQHSRLLGLDPA